jgi:hypothetical protein
MNVPPARLAALFAGLPAAIPLLAGVALAEVGCRHCHYGTDVDVSGAALAAAGGITDADRSDPSSPDASGSLTGAACTRICPPAPDGLSLAACVEINKDASGAACGPTLPDWMPSDPVPAGCDQTVACTFDSNEPCSTQGPWKD